MSTGPAPVAVLGSTGFIGRSVVRGLGDRHAAVRPLRAPRVSAGEIDHEAEISRLVDRLSGCSAVVNAAGVADAVAHDDHRSLRGANAVLPGLVAEAARRLGLRLVHVSSAAVQGERPELDSSPETAPFSPYSEAKAAGETAVLERGGSVVVYRPPGVHGPERTTTHTIARLARSPLSSVAGAGRRRTANVLSASVGDAVAFLALTDREPPRVVHHPSEGLTTGGLMRALGGHDPHHVPERVARLLLGVVQRAARLHPPLRVHARRLDMLWFGQAQAPSWLTDAGWTPPQGPDGWVRLGQLLRRQDERHADR